MARDLTPLFSPGFSLDAVEAELPSALLTEPSREMRPLRPADPARLGYPPTFPVEIAMKTASVRQICEEYGVSEAEWECIRHDELFLTDLRRALDMLKQEGMSFRLKAKLQAEELLKSSWRMIHDPATPANVRSQLIQSTMRWAQYDTPPALNGAAAGAGFSISINFAEKHEPRVING